MKTCNKAPQKRSFESPSESLSVGSSGPDQFGGEEADDGVSENEDGREIERGANEETSNEGSDNHGGQKGETNDEANNEGELSSEEEGDECDQESEGDDMSEASSSFGPQLDCCYSSRVLRQPGFPTDNLAIGLLIAWDHTGRMTSRRKLDKLLSILRDPTFHAALKTNALRRMTATRLRTIAKRFPLIRTEKVKTTKTVARVRQFFLPHSPSSFSCLGSRCARSRRRRGYHPPTSVC